jgi:hypothetical protein
VKALRDAHVGETATIVGMGPSILGLAAADFGPGPIITLNHAIRTVRALKLANPLYTMQKDGCIPHGRRGQKPPRIPIRCCACPSPRTVPPLDPEELLLSWAESSRCFPTYPRRHVFDVERDFGMGWNTMSAPVAVKIATWMGCTSLRMRGFDAYTCGDGRRVAVYGVGAGSARGYARSGAQAAAIAAAAGLSVTWGLDRMR